MDPARFQQHLLDAIPLARAMALSVTRLDAGGMEMRAPLADNRNDKGCAFGGSLASLLTLASWGSVLAVLGEDAEGAEVYVQDSHIEYLAPVFQDLRAQAGLATDDDAAAFLTAWRSRGKARVATWAEVVLDDGSVAARLTARFVALDPARRSATIAASEPRGE
ncbi:MAG: YiiD C-terminal domain-containing protein [Xanthomonadales bacterium]|nr:YiiD C-terminal domain-containing protein [Xanthomonadales bacterium]